MTILKKMLRPAVASCVVLGTAVAGVPSVASASPPPGRAYELVSPADDPAGAPAGVASDSAAMPGMADQAGDALIYGAPGPVGAAFNGAPNPLIFGVRDPEKGWSAETVPRTADGGETALNFSGGEAIVATATPDASAVVFGMADRLVPGVGAGVYRVDRGMARPFWISAPIAPVAPEAGVSSQATASRDLSTVAFMASAPIVPGGPPVGVYVARGGSVELASVLPGGAPAAAPFIANARGTASASSLPALRFQNTLTPDGRYLFFGDEYDSTREASLYVRDLVAEVTWPLAVKPVGAATFAGRYGSPPLDLNARSGIHDGYVSVARDAPVAFFRGTSTVTTPSSIRFYEASLVDGVVTFRDAITGPPVRVSDDGDSVLFIHVPSRTTSDPFEIRLWQRSSPASSVLLGTVPQAHNSGSSGGLIRFARSVNGGGTWVFGASGSLDPTNPNLKPTALQVYRWNVGDAHPTCLSCTPMDGVARFLGANMGVSETNVSESVRKPTGVQNSVRAFHGATPARSASKDGRIVAFDSPDRLTAEDQNDVRDVYLWDADAPTGQQLQLVTSGQGTAPSFFLDLDESGRNVFFTTPDGLVEADRDLAYDVYSARVGGGFPAAPDLSCTAEECRPPTIAPPVFTLPTSNVLTPPSHGDRRPAQEGAPKLRVRSVRTSRSRLTVRVDTPTPGRIRVSGKRVRTTNRIAKRATTYTLRLPLTASTRRSVARGRKVKVSFRVQFTPEGSKKSTRVSSSVSVRKGR